MSAEPAITPQQFAQAVLAAFEAADLPHDDDVRDAGGPSSTTMTKYRKVAEGLLDMGEPRSDSYKAIDKAARLRPGSARALWRRGVPLPPPGVRPRDAARLRAIIEAAEELDEDEAKRAKLLRVLDAG